MADDFERSDILGSSSPVGPGRLPRTRTPMSWSSLVLLAAAFFVSLLVLRRAHAGYMRWKERHHRLATRRRYGIPDIDHRPFTIAYAAVQRTRDDKDRRPPLAATFPKAATPDRAQDEGLRHRSDRLDTLPRIEAPLHPPSTQNGGLYRQAVYQEEPRRLVHSPALPGSMQGLTSPEVFRHDRLEPSPPTHTLESDATQSETLQQFPAESYPEPTHDEPRPVLEMPPARKPKRMAEASDDGGDEPSPHSHRHHDKRRRKVSNRSAPPIAEDVDMEVDEVSELPLTQSRRGKKRDRAEAGSTMGDDDAMDLDAEEQHRSRRRRHHRKSLTKKRGQKRERGSDETSEEDDDIGNRLSGKTARRRHDDGPAEDSDIAMSDSRSIRSSATIRGRRVGEEWEAHGFKHKIGPDGQRLTQALIREDRPLYSMPQDSAHPDREALVEVVREVWLTDQEMRDAKDRQMLAWQSPVKAQTPSDTPRTGRLSLPPTISGKELLWASAPNSPKERFSSPKERFGSSVSTPLRLASVANGTSPSSNMTFRRSLLSSSIRPLESSPAKPTGKGYTKWQKQEIEAESMELARRKREEKAKAVEDEAKRKAEEETKKAASMPPPAAPIAFSAQKDNTSASTSASASVPTPSAPSQSAPALPKAPFSFAPSTSSPLAPPKDADKVKPGAPAETGTSGFPFPSVASTPSVPASTSSAPTSASTTAPHTSSSIPNFFARPTPSPAAPSPAAAPSAGATPSFFTNVNKPSTPAAPTPAPAPTTGSVPNFFAKPAASTPSPFAAPSSTPTTSASQEKKPMFSFATPSAPASTASSPFPAPATASSSDASKLGQTAPAEGSKLKFSFTAPTSTKSASATSTPTASTPAQPAKSTFSFGFSGASGSPSPAIEKKDGDEQGKPKFSFGTTAGGFFGKSAATADSAKPAAGEPAKSVFGVSSAPGEQAKSVFGAPAASDATKSADKPTPASVFGPGAGTGMGATNPFGATTSAFGTKGSVFGNPSPATTTTTTPSSSGPAPPKSTFSFGTTSAIGGSPAKSVFGGAPSTAASSPFGAVSTGTASPFGAGSTGAASPFKSASGSAPPPFAAAANASQPSSASGTTPVFGTTGSGATPGTAPSSDAAKSGFSFSFGKPGGTPGTLFGASASGGASAFGFGNVEKKE